MEFYNRKPSKMHKRLVILAFKKARKERRKIGDNKPSLKKLAEDIACEIDFIIGERSLRDYYNNATKPESFNKDINISQLVVVNSLSKYLGYRDYEEFNSNQFSDEQENEEEPPIIIIKEGKDVTTKENSNKNTQPNNGRISIWLQKNQKAIISLHFLL